MDLENLRQINWLTSQHPSEALMIENEDYENPVPLTDEFKNKILFENNIILNLIAQRYLEAFRRISIEGPCSVQKLINSIYEFYQENIPANSLDNIPNDIWNYVQTAKEKMSQGNSVKWIEIMGDMQFFEGICQHQSEENPDIIEENVFDVILGS